MFTQGDSAFQPMMHCPNDLEGPATAPSSPVRTWYELVKTLTDFGLAALLLVLTSPLVLLAAIAVKLTSTGPIFYSQTRVGRKGRPYAIYKIRTMYHNCEWQSGVCWSTKGDPRITPIGRFLRVTHIDELPQLWNVLRGEMSLVGPRPERPEFVPGLEKAVPRYRERLNVRPGITGLAQVQLPPDSDVASVARKLAHDLYYIENLSWWLDGRILASTAFLLFGLPFWIGRFVFGLPGDKPVELMYTQSIGTDRIPEGTPIVINDVRKDEKSQSSPHSALDSASDFPVGSAPSLAASSPAPELESA